MKVVVLGATGLLGNAVGRHMIKLYGRDNVRLTCRRGQGISLFYNFGSCMGRSFDVLTDDLVFCHDVDYIINCIGIIKPFVESTGVANTILINSVFPHVLAEHCNQNGIRLIHITTDCVYSGKKGMYTEEDAHDCQDIYGMSKAMGETTEAMTLRTSIIGNEIHKDASLVAWARSQAGKHVKGFTNHLWNGVTTNEYARICEQIIEGDMWEKGVFHVFSDTVTKYKLLGLLNEHFELGLDIEPCAPGEVCDRTLSTVKPLKSQLVIQSIRDQIKEL
jgi:dTDP-4-dehydrorhamnose reductase